MDIKGFVNNHKGKILAIGTVVLLCGIALISGNTPAEVAKCLTSFDPTSVACQVLLAPVEPITTTSIVTN